MKKSRNNWLVIVLVFVLIAVMVVPTVSGSMDSVSAVAGRDGKDGKDGKDGQDGLTPIFRVNSETNEWEYSYSGGLSWISLGVQASEKFDENHKLNPEYIDQAWYANYGKEGGGTTVIIPEQTVTGGMWQYRQMDIQPGINYDVYINGEKYTCMAFNDDGGICLGNKANMSGDYPFCIYWAGGAATGGMFLRNSTLSYPLTLKVTDAYVNTYNKLPEQYLPDNLLTKEDLPALGGGTTLDVTAQPGQTIVVKEVDENGKPISWEAADVQERTHWSEYEETVLVDNQSFGEYSEEAFDFLLVAGQSYHIVFDGVEYDEVARSVDFSGMALVTLGNGVWLGEEDNGKPYAFQSMEGIGTIPTSVDSSAFVLTLSTVNEIVYEMPIKYIPDEVQAYAPVYVLCMQGESLDKQLPMILTTQLEAMVDAGRTVIMKASTTNIGTIYLYLAHDVTIDGKRMFVFSNGQYFLTLTPLDDGIYSGELVGNN